MNVLGLPGYWNHECRHQSALWPRVANVQGFIKLNKSFKAERGISKHGLTKWDVTNGVSCGDLCSFTYMPVWLLRGRRNPLYKFLSLYFFNPRIPLSVINQRMLSCIKVRTGEINILGRCYGNAFILCESPHISLNRELLIHFQP